MRCFCICSSGLTDDSFTPLVGLPRPKWKCSILSREYEFQIRSNSANSATRLAMVLIVLTHCVCMHMLVIFLALFPTPFLAESPPEGRGFGDGKSQQAQDLHMLGDIAWWYDWSLSPNNETAKVDNGAEFVAMAWGKRHHGVPLNKWLSSWIPHASTRHLLGFNEPNLRRQSNLTTNEVREICNSVSLLLINTYRNPFLYYFATFLDFGPSAAAYFASPKYLNTLPGLCPVAFSFGSSKEAQSVGRLSSSEPLHAQQKLFPRAPGLVRRFFCTRRMQPWYGWFYCYTQIWLQCDRDRYWPARSAVCDTRNNILCYM